MKKITRTNTGIQGISINRLLPTKNIRSDYGDIEELARSIERDGLLQPIKVSAEGDGYRIIYGHRRAQAFRLLADEDKPTYSVISAIIEEPPSNITVVQLVENIQRKNLNPGELEQSVKSLIDSGMTQTEVAKRLNKRLSWVSDVLAAGNVREKAETQGVSLEGISTSAVSQLRSVESEKLPEVVEKVKKEGGTVKAATKTVKEEREPKIGDPYGIPVDVSAIKIFDAQMVLEILMRLRDKVLEIEIDGMVRAQHFLDAIDEEIEKL